MEANTASVQTTGSKTIADLTALAAKRYGDRPAVRHKQDGAWRKVEIRVNRPDLKGSKILARRGYFAPYQESKK